MSKDLAKKGEIGICEVDLEATNVTDNKKITFLRLFERNTCNISLTCKKTGINRRTYYRWLASDSEFKVIAEAVREGMIDWMESKLYSQIDRGNLTAAMFALKCQGKHRGWQEYAKIDHRVEHVIPEIKIVLSAEKRDEIKS